MCTHLWYTFFKKRSETCSLHDAIRTGKTQVTLGRSLGMEKTLVSSLLWPLIVIFPRLLSAVVYKHGLYGIIYRLCWSMHDHFSWNPRSQWSNWECSSRRRLLLFNPWRFQSTNLQKTWKMRGTSTKKLT